MNLGTVEFIVGLALLEEAGELSGKRPDGYLDRLYKLLMNGRLLLKLRRNWEQGALSDSAKITPGIFL